MYGFDFFIVDAIIKYYYLLSVTSKIQKNDFYSLSGIDA